MTTRDDDTEHLHKALTLREVATALRVSLSTVYVLLSDGRLVSVRFGRARRIPVASVRRLLQTQPRTLSATVAAHAATGQRG